ncbi:MAG: cytidylate kinase-like family protein [candidate division Zixibacteria bacterium]|nr:cytidylate kinase-like family protein [candidate division Zixibacteria bacterium]
MTSIDAIINRQLLKWELQRKKEAEETPERPQPPPIVTVSRQKGSRGSYFASRLSERLGYQRLHREVIDTICQSSGYRKRIIESLDNNFRGGLELMVESLFTGQSVDHYDYFKHMCRTVLSMSRLGGVVVVGRGGNFILGLKRGFHIRFIAPEWKRVENLVKYKQMNEADAARLVESSDNSRRDFIRKLFNADIDDPNHYDLVINSIYIDIEELLDTTMTAVKGKLDKLTFLEHDTI